MKAFIRIMSSTGAGLVAIEALKYTNASEFLTGLIAGGLIVGVYGFVREYQNKQ